MIREAPVRLPGEGSGVGVGVRDAFLDGLLDDGHVLLQGVGGPGVQHDVQELTDVTSDLLGLTGGLLTNDRDEPEYHRVSSAGSLAGLLSPRTESVLNDELETDQAAGGHHFSAVLDQVDHGRQEKF